MSPPRIERISRPLALSLTRSTCDPSARVRTISPSTMRPGRSTMRRIDCAVTLFPQPLSPTMPSVFPGETSNEAPSTALVVPSSWKKLVLRFLTERSGLVSFCMIGARLQVGVGRIPHPVPHEIESEDRHDDGNGGEKKPRRYHQRLDVLGILQQDTPTDRRRPQAQPQETQRSLADDDRRDRQGRRRDDVTYERGHHVAEDDPRLAATDELGRHDEILLLEGDESPPDDPGELGPADQRYDDRDGEVNLHNAPIGGKRSGQAHPEGNRRNRAQDLDDPLDDRIDRPAEIAGYAAQDDAQHQTQGHADQAYRHRRSRRVHEARPEVASVRVRSHQEQRLARLGAFDGNQVTVGRDEAQQLIRLSMAEELDRYLGARVGNVDPLEREGIARSFQRVHVRPEASLVGPVNRLRRHQRSLGLGFRRIDVGEEVGEQRNQIKRNQDDGPAHRELVLAKAPPDELPLRCGVFRHHSRPNRILGSTHMRSRSEMNVPMTVITPSSRMMVPARNISWAINALRSSGPTVGRLSTSDTMMLPDTT